MSRASLVQQQYKVHTKVRVRVAIDALDYEYNHDVRARWPRLTAGRLQLAAGRRGLGPREQGEQRTQRASFVATGYVSCESTHRAAALVLGSDALLKRNTT